MRWKYESIQSRRSSHCCIYRKRCISKLTEDLIALRSYLIDKAYPFITEIVPTESDLMICYDARDMIKHHNIQSPFLYMKALIDSVQLEIKHNDEAQQPLEVPIVYGDEFGPDLPELLKYLKLKLSDFIQLHTGTIFCFNDGIFSWISLFNRNA